MDHFEKIYVTKAKDYHQMIVSEDMEGNILSALQDMLPLENAILLDLGSGTGRIPLLIHNLVRQVIALDLNYPMLQEQKNQKNIANGSWSLVHGNNQKLPFPKDWADIITVGWAIGHLRAWFKDDWKTQVRQVLSEMERVAVPGGSLVILETLTTGALDPSPPTPELAEYYVWLENDWAYSRQTIQTDYQFDSVDEAVTKTEFFFGPELADLIRKNNWSRLPEWTGVWRKIV